MFSASVSALVFALPHCSVYQVEFYVGQCAAQAEFVAEARERVLLAGRAVGGPTGRAQGQRARQVVHSTRHVRDGARVLDGGAAVEAELLCASGYGGRQFGAAAGSGWGRVGRRPSSREGRRRGLTGLTQRDGSPVDGDGLGTGAAVDDSGPCGMRATIESLLTGDMRLLNGREL